MYLSFCGVLIISLLIIRFFSHSGKIIEAMYYTIILLVFLLLISFISGLNNPKVFNQRTKKAVLKIHIVFLILLVIFINITTLIYTPETSNQKNKLEFSKIKTNLKSISESEFTRQAKKFEGERVSWNGRVESIEESKNDKFEIWLIKNNKDNKDISLPNVYLLNISANEAQKIEKGDDLSFKGTIKSIDNIFTGIRVNLIKVEI